MIVHTPLLGRRHLGELPFSPFVTLSSSAPQLFFVHSGCNLSNVRLLLPPVLTHQFLNAPDRDTGREIEIKILSDYHLHYL